MTKKDYIRLADRLVRVHKRKKFAVAYGEGMGTWFDGYADAIQMLCEVLKADNPNFDEEKFFSYIVNKL